MKKRVLLILLCITFIFSSLCVGAVSPDASIEEGCSIVINGEETENTSVVSGGTHYLPARAVFEKVGSLVYFRSRDCQMLILSRDGDMIQHVVGTSSITVNGEVKNFPEPSFSENNITYFPTDMMTAAFRSNAISVGNGKISVNKAIYDTAYGKAVKEVMDARSNGNFYPEKFKRYINYHIKNPASTMQDVLFMVNLGLDMPFYENVSVIGNPYGNRVLVNKYNRLPYGFAQKNLVNMDRKYTASDGKKYLLEAEAYSKYVQMADAAKQSGLTLRVVSAYRTEDYQNMLYNKKTRTLGKNNVDNYSARPGFSEHQTGLAVDINSTKTSFERSAEFKWLQEHAHEYGFIMRYPKGKKWITGYEYEPWHYRYVGIEAAKIIHAEGTTYEQYYAKYISKSEFK